MVRQRHAGLVLVLVGAVAMFAAACVPPDPNPTNQLPTAVIVANPTSGTVPLTVSFDGSGSIDPDGSINVYAWTFGDGGTASAVVASHTYTSVGSFTATLTVTDNAGATNAKTVAISVGAQAPTAVITATPESGKEPLIVAFNGAGSTDPDGTITNYAWVFGDGGTATGATVNRTYLAAGSYAATLTVTDNDGATNTASKVINVTPNQAPTAVAAGTPTTGKEPLTVAFTSAGSADPDGSIAGYQWDFDTNGTVDSTAPNPSHTYTAFGNYTATLTVTDDNGATATDTVATTVNANQPPTAVANATPSGGFVPLTVLFNGSSSTDADGTIVSYLWNFGNGTFSNFPNPVTTYGAIGTYSASLTVTDDNGVTSTDVITISVNGVPNVPPTAVANGTPTSGKEPLTVAFSSAGSIDTDGTIVAYAWDFGDGTTSALPSPSKLYPTAGNRTATLTVTDNNGAQATATVPIVVNPNQAPTATASGTPTSGKEPLIVAFSSGGSSDPDGTIVSRSWDFGDGTSSSSASPSKTYAAAGNFTSTLTVTDDNGATAIDTVAIVVNANVAPTAVLNASPTSGRRPLVVSFNSSASVDPDGTIVSRSLNFGDGSPASNAVSTTHTYAVGTWTATQSVTDDNGVTSTVGQTITVVIDDDNDGVSPPADCNDSVASTFPGAADALDGAGTDSNCDGVDGVLTDTILVAASGGSDGAACGTAVASPCQTIPFGIGRANSTSRKVILVTSGPSYGGFAVTGGTNQVIRGGYAAGFASRSGTTVSTSGVATTSTTGLTLRDLTINGPGGVNTTAIVVNGGTVTLNGVTGSSGAATGAGSSAYGLRAIGGSTVTVQNSNISASTGVAGTSGSTPTGGLTAGTNGGSGTVGNTNDPSPPTGATGGGTGANNGGNGGNSNAGNGAAGTNGGAGGTGGCNNCRSNSNYSGGGAQGGRAGGNGATGGQGAASAPAYGALFQPTTATNGSIGANGGGGGGGGAGGQGCNAGLCAGERVSGGSGAKGGGGGQGGGGGTAGTAAGGSFAVYSQNSTVNIDGNTTLTTASGGNGGNGAIGQGGASGGSGGTGGSGIRADCCTGTGGGGGSGGGVNANGNNGGDGSAGTCCNGASGGGGGGGGGGNGGIGGSGGGGTGGPSVAMLAKGTGGITFGGNLTSQVTGGAGGAGGASPNGGNAGVAGTAAKQLNVA